MASIIDADTLRKEVQNEFSNKQGTVEEEDMTKLYDIVTEINKKERKLRKLPKSLERLVQNILCIHMYNRIICDEIDYNEDTIIKIIMESIEQTYIIIDIIKEVAEELDTQSKKDAFYRLMENNHVYMASVYILRNEFFNSSINVLCDKAGLQGLDDKINSENVMIKLCELTESGECSRLQRALDILVKHGDNLTITDKNGIIQSNASNLGITDDDIKSLQLLTKTNKWDATEFSEFLIGSIYGSICDKIEQNGRWHPVHSIYELYSIVYNASIDEIDTAYKADIIKHLKENLNNLSDNERVFDIDDPFDFSDIFNDLIKNQFITDKFKNNVVQKYLDSIEPTISIINETADPVINETVVPFKHKFKRVLSIIFIFIFIIIFIIILSVFKIFPNETKEIMNNLNKSLF
ncbi:hypothetical protein NEPAR04_0857 [Nematocida parisii]|nr:hypothetical protein NEPAR08_0903 [Nematocida parisii]KAI5129021.1 hypothetical protein NEPAR03_1467 [Nematocida parisii]KAI5141295.1 hypothetical protein NEPAR04_0857 [Nematocida parisii]